VVADRFDSRGRPRDQTGLWRRLMGTPSGWIVLLDDARGFPQPRWLIRVGWGHDHRLSSLAAVIT
jgi:hypothetical protein